MQLVTTSLGWSVDERQPQPGRPEELAGSVSLSLSPCVSRVFELKALAVASQTSPYKSPELLGFWCLSLSQSEAASLCLQLSHSAGLQGPLQPGQEAAAGGETSRGFYYSTGPKGSPVV